MLGSLTENQCKHILKSNHIGRIGFHDDSNKISIIPVTYVSDGDYIYGHALEGSKISAMRKHQSICFQMDNIDNLANWRSVIVHGIYEEVKSAALQTMIKNLFFDHLHPIITGETVSTTRELDRPPQHIIKKTQPVIYRIAIQDITGRFEKS